MVVEGSALTAPRTNCESRFWPGFELTRVGVKLGMLRQIGKRSSYQGHVVVAFSCGLTASSPGWIPWPVWCSDLYCSVNILRRLDDISKMCASSDRSYLLIDAVRDRLSELLRVCWYCKDVFPYGVVAEDRSGDRYLDGRLVLA